jgi:hypothetical protein
LPASPLAHGALVWPNDADFDPDVLYEAAHGWITAPPPGGEIRLSSPADRPAR